MNQPEILDSDIRYLQQWLRAAWQQLGDPSLTTFSRRELRNQMFQSGRESAGFAGLKWMYDGIDPTHLFD